MDTPPLPNLNLLRARAQVEQVLDLLHRTVFNEDVELTLVVRHKTNPEAHLMVSASKIEDLRTAIDQLAPDAA